MAVNVVIALYYYLAWAARLFATPDAATASVGRSPATLRMAIGLTVLVSVMFSVWPQPALGAF